ncbi:trypsin-like serine peptidase [Bdellovibrio reynosensis]|uniref:Serine protease n=1 Tax=Bdellovibrio reynosensis TaxID=2835041 RepID=A0ABY4C9Z4_9BACT|nr:serine protease [Bdellovibrio reynosensis]UOF01737.1 serine protease [Bdellovibrio reynosensis]
MRLILLAASLLLASCSASQESLHTDGAAVIYGDDSRTDISSEDLNLQKIASAVSVIIEKSKLKPAVDGMIPFTRTLGQSYPLCESEKFQNQPLLGFCTGVLIGKNKVLTAGHCMDQKNRCAESLFVFGFNASKAESKVIPLEEIYRCKQVLKLQNRRGHADYAVIELDREVNAEPVALASEKTYAVGEPLLSLSYPLGLPLKKDLGRVLRDTEGAMLKMEVDTFSGSSGSPLFNAKGALVGILSTGMDDILEDDIYRVQTEGGCIEFNRCKNGTCFGETYTKVHGIDL